MRQIPLKNYLILFLIYLLVILFSFGLRNWYLKNYVNNSHINEVISEIKIEEFESYIQENPDVIIYFSNTKNADLNLEQKMINYIVKKNLTSNIVYVDTHNIDKEWFKKINNNYLIDSSNIQIVPNIDNIVLVKNGKIEVSAVYNEILDYEKFKEFMNRYGVLNND